jgi:glycosyltransferase involved in cell wall biosynthesis
MDRAIFVILPAYNEEHLIRSTLETLLKYDYAIVVVDDGSKDQTWALASQLPVYLLRHPINLGQGAALKTATLFALSRGAEYIVHFDADGQHKAEDIETLLEPLYNNQSDVVLGSRFLRPSDVAEVPSLRRIILKGAVVVNGLLTGVWLTDAHNGFRALNRNAAQKIQLRENGFAHATEIIAEVRRNKLRYVEKPTHITYSHYSLMKGQSLWNSLNILIDVILRKVFR